MVNKEKIIELIKWYTGEVEKEPNFVNWPWMQRDFWDPIVEALGDNEDDIIEYLNSLDLETLGWVEGVYEELTEKFPGDRIGEAFKRYRDYKKEKTRQ